MADVKLVPAKCPSCGAGLQIPEDQDKTHCIYCGSQVFVRKSHPVGKECKVCDGYGRIDVCKACGGSGSCAWYDGSAAQGKNDLLAWAKYGTEAHCDRGMCSACGGQPSGGSLSSCPFCGGTGRCPRCLGTAKCSACRGLGVIPGPSGSEICPGCGGKGHLEGEPPKAPKIDKCPDCGRAIDADSFFCAGCGFAKACPGCGSAWPRGSRMCPVCGYRKGVTR